MTTASQRRLMETAAHSPGGYGGVAGRNIVGDDEGACAAGVILRAPDGTCLFLKRAWSSSTFPGTWCWPAGRCEDDEGAEDAARRETKEETGYNVEGPLHEFDIGEADGGKFATYVRDVPEKFIPDLRDGEHIGFAWAPPSEPPEPLHPGVKATLAKDEAESDGRFDWSDGDLIIEHVGTNPAPAPIDDGSDDIDPKDAPDTKVLMHLYEEQ